MCVWQSICRYDYALLVCCELSWHSDMPLLLSSQLNTHESPQRCYHCLG
jgi:hypothetical protein